MIRRLVGRSGGRDHQSDRSPNFKTPHHPTAQVIVVMADIKSPNRATDPPANWFARFLFQGKDIPEDVPVSEDDCVKQQGEVTARSFGMLFGVSEQEREKSERRLLMLRLYDRDKVIDDRIDAQDEVIKDRMDAQDLRIDIQTNIVWGQDGIFDGVMDRIERYWRDVRLHRHETEIRFQQLTANVDSNYLNALDFARITESRSRQHIERVAANHLEQMWSVERRQLHDAQKRQSKLEGLIDRKVDALDEKLTGKVDNLEAKVDALEAKVAERMDALEAKMDKRMDAHEAKVMDVLAQILARLPAPP